MDAFNNILFLTGVVLMAASAVGALAALAAFCISGRRLRENLEAEFGKKQ